MYPCVCLVVLWFCGGPLAFCWPRVRLVASGGFGLGSKVWLLRFGFCGVVWFPFPSWFGFSEGLGLVSSLGFLANNSAMVGCPPSFSVFFPLWFGFPILVCFSVAEGFGFSLYRDFPPFLLIHYPHLSLISWFLVG